MLSEVGLPFIGHVNVADIAPRLFAVEIWLLIAAQRRPDSQVVRAAGVQRCAALKVRGTESLDMVGCISDDTVAVEKVRSELPPCARDVAISSSRT